MEHVEQISIQVQQLKKKLAWSWVYDVDQKLEQQNVKIEKLKNRIPTCQAKIDHHLVCMPASLSYNEAFLMTHFGNLIWYTMKVGNWICCLFIIPF